MPMLFNHKTGIAIGLLLLPVFLYLLLSIPIRPDTKVPNEYKKSMNSCFFEDDSLFHDKISVVFFPNKENLFLCIEKMLWFDQLFNNKYNSFQLLINSSEDAFVDSDIEVHGLSKHAKVIGGKSKMLKVVLGLEQLNDHFILIDQDGELRGVYLLDNDKSSNTAKIEMFILMKNLVSCQKKS
jgi:hypothetical protein